MTKNKGRLLPLRPLPFSVCGMCGKIKSPTFPHVSFHSALPFLLFGAGAAVEVVVEKGVSHP